MPGGGGDGAENPVSTESDVELQRAIQLSASTFQGIVIVLTLSSIFKTLLKTALVHRL